MKRCSKCETVKPFDEFAKSGRTKDGLSGHCKQCKRGYYARNRETYKARHKEKYARQFVEIRERTRAYYRDNAERMRETARRRYAGLPIEKRAEVARKAAIRDKTVPGAASERVARRRARLTRAMPKWANPEKIREFYESADALGMLTGEWFHVDHVIPLRGRTVCGLHNEFNLQILPAAENIKKSNKDWPGKP